MKKIQKLISEKLIRIIKENYGFIPPEIVFSIPPKRKFGDISTTLPFTIAKKTGKKPFVIANEIIGSFEDKGDLISDISVMSGGFLNFKLKRESFFSYLLKRNEVDKKNEKIVVEHTSINPNKSAHIGHLRNAVIGDTLARGLSLLGYDVEVQNYLDDTGIQVADVVWGLVKQEGKDLDEIKRIDDLPGYLWKKYPEYSSFLKKDEEKSIERGRVHADMESGKEPFYSIGEYVSEIVAGSHIEVMSLLDIRYDLLVRERDIIKLDFFGRASKVLMEHGIMYDSKDPDKKGCRVILYKRENIEKIIVRSNGTITYIGKDIAYALWKVGLLGMDFYYKIFSTRDNEAELYITDYEKRDCSKNFGNASYIFTVIDVRQSYLQKIISEEVIDKLSSEASKKEYIHFSYEMVALSPRCVEELGFNIPEEDKKRSYIEVSGRKGIAVSADELMEKLLKKASEEIKKRHPELNQVKIDLIAKQISVGALRYFMIKFNSNSVITFDFNDALSFEGDTGPYLQYTMVRINSIMAKLGEDCDDMSPSENVFESLNGDESGLVMEILLKVSDTENQVEMAIDKRELSFISTHCYTICHLFNQYYHKYPISSEQDKKLKVFRVDFLKLVARELKRLLDLLGIPVPERM